MAEQIEPPDRSRHDDGLEIVASGVLGPIPLVGPAVQALVERWIAEPYERRLQAFFGAVATRLNDLTAGLDEMRREAILGKPELVSAISMAVRAAEHTHQQEKLDSLRNAVLNIALGVDDLEYDTAASLLRCVDELTTTHVRVLRIMANPAEAAKTLPPEANPVTLADIVDGLLPGLDASNEETTEFQRIERDLFNVGLVVAGLAHDRRSSPMTGVATIFGHHFLRLIEEPKQLD